MYEKFILSPRESGLRPKFENIVLEKKKEYWEGKAEKKSIEEDESNSRCSSYQNMTDG